MSVDNISIKMYEKRRTARLIIDDYYDYNPKPHDIGIDLYIPAVRQPTMVDSRIIFKVSVLVDAVHRAK